MISSRKSFLAFFLAFSPSIALFKSLRLLTRRHNEAIDLPQHVHVQPVHTVQTDDSFAACLLIMDDNHILIEWLAYHYHILPLRRLIVAVDPRSQTSPTSILDRYRERGLMKITDWTDEDLMPAGHAQIRESLNRKKDPKKIDPLVDLHRDRQSYFISQCLATLKDEGADWVIHMDTDEYILPNYNAQDPYRVYNTSNMTIHQMIQSKKQVDDHMGSTCISLPRLRVGTKESNLPVVENEVPNGLNASNFQTLRWRWRAKFDARWSNGMAKAMVDVSKIKHKYLQPDVRKHNAHRPVTKKCLVRHMFIDNANSTFLVHHYGGTWEQWSFRQDARRNLENDRTWEAYRKLQLFEDGETGHIRPWLSEFVQRNGQELASALLKGVGEVPPRKATWQ
jgi:hypothetical protein